MAVNVPVKGMSGWMDKNRENRSDGHADKFGELEAGFRRSYRRLFNQALGTVRSAEAADDVVQEAFANTLVAVERGQEIQNLDGWLSRCVHNGSIHYAKHRKQVVQPLEDKFEPVDPNSVPELQYARRRYNRGLCEAIDKLSPAQQSAFLLTDVRGMSRREVASELHCSENSVSQLLIRARKHVRRSLGPKRFVAVPIFWLLSRTYRFKEHTHPYLKSAGAKAAHLHSKTSAFLQRSAEMVGQPATALMAGAAVVVVLGTSQVEKKQSTNSEEVVSPQTSVVAPAPAAQKDPAPAANDTQQMTQTGDASNDYLPASSTPAEVGGSTPALIVGHGDSDTKKLNLKIPSESKDDPPKSLPASDPASSGGNEVTQPPVADANRKIAFTTNRDGDYEIYSMNADGSGQANLTNIAALSGIASNDIEPSWSGDGSKLAFTSTRNGSTEVYSMNGDGSGQTRLTNNNATDSEPGLSSDASKIAFRSGRDASNEIYSMNTDGSGQTRLTNNPASDGAPAWSPDGLKIAFETDRDGNDEIYSMNANGDLTTLTNLTNTGASEVEPDWSPDGTKIAFESFRDGSDDIYVMNTDGSGQTRLTTNPGSDQSPEWSPDGSQITFQSDRDGNQEIYVMNADGSSQTNISQSPGSVDATPTW